MALIFKELVFSGLIFFFNLHGSISSSSGSCKTHRCYFWLMNSVTFELHSLIPFTPKSHDAAGSFLTLHFLSFSFLFCNSTFILSGYPGSHFACSVLPSPQNLYRRRSEDVLHTMYMVHAAIKVHQMGIRCFGDAFLIGRLRMAFLMGSGAIKSTRPWNGLPGFVPRLCDLLVVWHWEITTITEQFLHL